MHRILLIAAGGLALSACAGIPGLSSFQLPGSGPTPTTVQFESVPAGAEARTSLGEACQTPCAMTVASDDFTVTFSQAGFQPQTVPVRNAPPNEPVDPVTGDVPAARLSPNPVYVELQPAGAPARRGSRNPRVGGTPSGARPVAAAARPATARPAVARPATPRPVPASAPEPAPAAAWPPVTR